MRQINPKQRDPNIDAGIDLYIYGLKFFHYDRKELGDVRVDMGDGKPWVPVQDWMKEGKKFSPDQLRAFAFYTDGRHQLPEGVYFNGIVEEGIRVALLEIFPELGEMIRQWRAEKEAVTMDCDKAVTRL